MVVGVTGPWGSGKSSIINLLRERLKAIHPGTVVISFDPWLISGRNDLISEFFNELLTTIKSKSKLSKHLKNLTQTFTEYSENLATAGSLVNPAFGVILRFGSHVLTTARARDKSLNALRRKLLEQLSEASVPIIVLIDELDRIENSEIRTVAQLVRSVVDFPGISYVLAYDESRVIQALGSDASEGEREERGRAYLEKIVQLQIPLPVIFSEEIGKLLIAELTALREDLKSF